MIKLSDMDIILANINQPNIQYQINPKLTPAIINQLTELIHIFIRLDTSSRDCKSILLRDYRDRFRNKFIIITAMIDNEIIGFIYGCSLEWYVNFDVDDSDRYNTIYLRNCVVKDIFRHCGVASKLISLFIDYVTALGMKYVTLYASNDNAKEIYLHKGFKPLNNMPYDCDTWLGNYMGITMKGE